MQDWHGNFRRRSDRVEEEWEEVDVMLQIAETEGSKHAVESPSLFEKQTASTCCD